MAVRNRTPLPILVLLITALALLAGCTRDRATPEPAAAIEELPAEPVATEVDTSAQEVVEEPDVVQLTSDEEETPEPEEEAAPETFQYIVEPGDTLLSIALEYETDVETLKERNNLFGDEISVGQPLLVPYVEGVLVPGMPTPTPGPFTYIVQQGETLGDIALKFGVEPLAIVEASDLLDQNTLSVGQELTIPGYQPPAPSLAPGSGENDETVAGGVVHIVQGGESLGIIADLYGVDANDIARINNVSNWNLLRVGQELIIPGVTPQEAAAIRGQIHVVKSGESLSQIAAQYGIDVDEIIFANGISDPNAIRVGMELIIPE